MGIYLPNMEMPTSCEDCPLGDSLHCQVLPSVPALWAEYTNAIREKRLHSDCPLTPVPPHGDLIDRDALPWENQGFMLTDPDEWGLKAWDIEHAPTIIPASEDGE